MENPSICSEKTPSEYNITRIFKERFAATFSVLKFSSQEKLFLPSLKKVHPSKLAGHAGHAAKSDIDLK